VVPSTHRRRATALLLFVVFGLIPLSGCSVGSGPAPTKIYEGGGTAPEVVDQPEKPAPKSTTGSPRP
jgi:hypothetical protein